MPNPNAVVARVQSLSNPIGGVAEDAAPRESTSVNLEGGISAFLPGGRRSRTWGDMLEFLRQTNTPAYLEIDPETSVITNVLMPQRLTAVAMEPTAAGDLHVMFRESHTGYVLLRSNPDFHDLLNAIEAARDAAAAVFVTATSEDHEIIDVQPAPPSPPPSPPPTPDVPSDEPSESDPPSVVSEAQAVQLFNDMVPLTCDAFTIPPGCITFNFPDDGCYARAHEMIRLMRLQGVEGEKIWIFAGANSDLHPFAATHPTDCAVNWWYHVAPTLQVNTSMGVEKRVIDPSLMTGPVTPQQWKDRQNDAAAQLFFTDATPFFPNAKNDPNGETDDDYSKTNMYLQQKRLALQSRANVYGAPPYACPVVKQMQFILDRSTFGQDEVTAMLQQANPNPAVIDAAFYVILDGYTPAEIGITGATPTDPPSVKPAFLPLSPPVAEMEIKAAHLDFDDPAHFQRRQRITWTYEVRFTGTAGFGFGGAVQTVSMAATLGIESAGAAFQLIKQPNPFEIDGATSWLSTDLRVFQINAGAPKFGATMGAAAADAPNFIQQVINNLNNGTTGGQTFQNDLSTDQQASKLELSEEANSVKVFNFAVARVRYVGLLDAHDVRVFFRMFPASTTSLVYDQSTTYRRTPTISLLGVQNNQLVTIPCFAAERVNSASVSLTTQTDSPNVRTIQASTTERSVYFGAWLDFNQLTPQFPLHPSPVDGPFPSDRVSIYELVRFQHQCLVAEIAFDPAPIASNATPGTSDKLAQRNLAFVESANPGLVASRRIPQTFEIRPTSPSLPDDAPHDELLIDWGNTPVGSTATIYLPQVAADEVLDLAVSMYRTSNLVRIDEHTLQCRTGGMSWIPIPKGEANFTGLITVDLPPIVKVRQLFRIVVRQVSGLTRPIHTPAVAVLPVGRRIIGSFQITIPVSTKETMLAPEQRLLSNLRFIERSIPADDRWYHAFRRYVRQVASRVDALGGDSTQVGPSPSGNWQQPGLGGTPGAGALAAVCRALEFATAALLATLILVWAAAGKARIVLALTVLLLLLVVAWAWIRSCQPSGARVARALLIGAVIGAVILWLLRMST